MTARSLQAVVAATIILAVFGCDQATKAVARVLLPGQGTVSVVGTVFVLRYAENEGAFLGLGAALPRTVRTALLVAVPAVAMAGVVAALLLGPSQPWLLIVGLALVAGGGLGNLADRLFRSGHVTDFLNLGIGRLRTGIFNVADLAVMAGCLLLLLSPARGKPAPTS